MYLLQSYGGNIIAMFSDEDKRLVKDLRREESMITSALAPSLWTIKRDFITEVRKMLEIADYLRFVFLSAFSDCRP